MFYIFAKWYALTPYLPIYRNPKIHLCSFLRLGMHFQITAHQWDIAREDQDRLALAEKPEEAVSGADIVYTDVWASMGQEAESEVRRQAFAGYQVDSKLLPIAKPDAIFMHDLPAHRGEEVTDDVIDGPQSVVFDQAENRMHAQKALLAKLLGGL